MNWRRKSKNRLQNNNYSKKPIVVENIDKEIVYGDRSNHHRSHRRVIQPEKIWQYRLSARSTIKVSPSTPSIHTSKPSKGLLCYASIKEIPGPVEIATLYIPPENSAPILGRNRRKRSQSHLLSIPARRVRRPSPAPRNWEWNLSKAAASSQPEPPPPRICKSAPDQCNRQALIDVSPRKSHNLISQLEVSVMAQLPSCETCTDEME